MVMAYLATYNALSGLSVEGGGTWFRPDAWSGTDTGRILVCLGGASDFSVLDFSLDLPDGGLEQIPVEGVSA